MNNIKALQQEIKDPEIRASFIEQNLYTEKELREIEIWQPKYVKIINQFKKLNKKIRINIKTILILLALLFVVIFIYNTIKQPKLTEIQYMERQLILN